MNRILFVFLMLLQGTTLLGQSSVVLVSGTVKDQITGELLIGANIFCPETETGSTTDVFGRFKLEVPVGNEVLVQCSFVGYKAAIVSLNTVQNKTINLWLEPGVDLGEVKVIGIRPIENRMEMGTAEIPVLQLKKLPMMGDPNILKAMQLMPGVQSGADGRSGLYVRGGSADQNLFLLDGTPVYYVNHLGGFFSIFNPDILKNVKLYKGAFPARYGGRLSSVVDLRMKEGNKKEHHGSWGIGILSGDVCMEGPIIKDRTSYIVSFRRVWFDLFLRPITKIGFKTYSMGYNFYDFFGKISHEQNANNRFYLSLYGGDDCLGYYYDLGSNKGHSRLRWGNMLSTLRWNHSFNANLSSDITLFYSRYRYRTDDPYQSPEVQGNNIYYSGVHDFGLKADFNYYISDSYQLNYGGGISGNWFKPGQISYRMESADEKMDTIIGGQNRSKALNSYLYVENEFRLTDHLMVNAGARLVDFGVEGKNYLSFEPRMLGTYDFGKYGALKASYSETSQAVHQLSYSGNSFPADVWIPSSASVAPGLASIFSVGYAKTLGAFELSLEAYTKKLKNQIDVKGGVPLVNTQSWDNNIEKDGIGTSKGVEMLLQKKEGKTTGWVAYTLSKSDRTFSSVNDGKSFPFKYDRRHDLSIVFNHKFSEKIDISATWVYGSGYPTTLNYGKYQSLVESYRDISSPNQEIFSQTGVAYLYPGKNWLRMRDYHRLDFGINFNKQKGHRIRTWTIGVYNAYNRQNAVFYYFDHKDGNGKGPIVLFQQSALPIIPTVKYSIKF